MAKHSTLNWEAARGKWKIEYRGKKFRFDGGTGKSDREARKAAESAWRVKKAEVDKEGASRKPHKIQYDETINEWTNVLAFANEHGETDLAMRARLKIDKLKALLARTNPPPIDPNDLFRPPPRPNEENPVWIVDEMAPGGRRNVAVLGPRPIEYSEWEDRFRCLEKRHPTGLKDTTFETNIEAFVNEKRNEVRAGQLSAGRADNLNRHLRLAKEHIGATTQLNAIGGQALVGCRQALLEQATANKFSLHYAVEVLTSLKVFLRWCVETDRIDALPKNLQTKSLRIQVPLATPQTLAVEQIKELVASSSDRTRLYLLCMLNAGMTQKDLSDLRPQEVDWKSGVLTRKRSKTAKHEGVPTVSYKLWPETLRLLVRFRTDDSERVLLTERGTPLKTEILLADGKLRKTDAVRLACRRLSKKTKIGFQPKWLKKTGASLIRNHPRFSGLEALFLDHAPRSMSDKHYAKVPQQLFDEAVKWLGHEFGFA